MKNLQLYEYYGPRGEHADKEERIELLIEAQAKLNEAIDLIEQGLKGTLMKGMQIVISLLTFEIG